MSLRHITSLVLAFAVGLLLPVVCVPDALAPSGHGWHLVLNEEATHDHKSGHLHGGTVVDANSLDGGSSTVLGPVPGAQSAPGTAGLPDAAAPPGSDRSGLGRSMSPGPAPELGTRPWILGADLSPPPR